MIQEGSLVYIYDLGERKKYLIRPKSGDVFSTHRGVFRYDDIINLNYGDKCKDSNDNIFLILRPNLADILMNLRRHTQIIYPKDIGYIMLKLGIRNGDKIIESGTGSGITTVAFAYCIHPTGKVYTYERNQEFSDKASKNIVSAGMANYVELKCREIDENNGFDETDVDSVFLDMKDPTLVIQKAYEALKLGGMLGMILPTVNQVIDVLPFIEKYKFIDIEVSEIMLRFFKLNSERLRPYDSMTRHTGYLVFARKAFFVLTDNS